MKVVVRLAPLSARTSDLFRRHPIEDTDDNNNITSVYPKELL